MLANDGVQRGGEGLRGVCAAPAGPSLPQRRTACLPVLMPILILIPIPVPITIPITILVVLVLVLVLVLVRHSHSRGLHPV